MKPKCDLCGKESPRGTTWKAVSTMTGRKVYCPAHRAAEAEKNNVFLLEDYLTLWDSPHQAEHTLLVHSFISKWPTYIAVEFALALLDRRGLDEAHTFLMSLERHEFHED